MRVGEPDPERDKHHGPGHSEHLDPEPAGLRERLFDYFGAACAYCGAELGPGVKACKDHADPRGGNHAGNRVLACSPCNDHEKRDMPWREFLRLKVSDDVVFAERERRILDWFAANVRCSVTRSPAVLQAEGDVRAVIDEFREKCIRLRQALRDEPANAAHDTMMSAPPNPGPSPPRRNSGLASSPRRLSGVHSWRTGRRVGR